MYAVVNHLPIKSDTDWAALADKVDTLNAGICHPGFRGFSLVRSDNQEAILLAFFTSRSALDDISRNVAGPWFAEHVRPYLAGPVNRSVGEIVAGALTAEA